MTDFKTELAFLINKYSKENGSNTPDWILAEYLNSCLDIFGKIINRTAPLHTITKEFQASSLVAFVDALGARSKWYGNSTPPEAQRPSGDGVEAGFYSHVEKPVTLADATGPRHPESKL